MKMSKGQFEKIRAGLTRLKANVGPRNTLFILYTFFMLLFAFIAMLLYRPLIVNIQTAQRELKVLDQELLIRRSYVDTLKDLKLEGRLMTKNELSQAINEITEAGRALGIKFISITPHQAQKAAGDNFSELAINFSIESEYENLGRFLASLEEFPRTIANVETLSVSAKGQNLPDLRAELLLKLYITN